MITFIQTVFFPPGVNQITIVPSELLARLSPEVKRPDFSKLVFEYVRVTRIGSDRSDLFSLSLSNQELTAHSSTLLDPNGVPTLAMVEPLTARDVDNPPPVREISDAELGVHPIVKGHPPTPENKFVVGINDPLKTRILSDSPTEVTRMSEENFDSLARAHLEFDLVVDMTTPLALKLENHSKLVNAVDGLVTATLEVKFGLVQQA